jgi:hypothetical protein
MRPVTMIPGPRDLLDVALFTGATRILQKPVDLGALVDVVRTLVPAEPPPPGAKGTDGG